MKRYVIRLLCIFALVGVVLYTFPLYRVTLNSLQPSILAGDLCLSFRFGDVSYNDVVLYTYAGSIHIGRVAGVEGNVIECSENSIFSNGIPMESKGTTPDMRSYEEVPEGCVYITSNEESQVDSRTLGALPKENIIGRVIWLFRYRTI